MQIPILSILDHVGVLVVVLHQAHFHRRAVRTAKGDGVGALLLQAFQVQTAADQVAQRLLERLAELPVEVRVDDGVHRRVEVAHPEEQVHEELGRPPVDDGADDVPDEEGEPAGDEGAHDDAQRFGRLVLALHLADGPLGGRARTRFRVLGVRVSVPARLDLLGFVIFIY